MHPRNRPGPSAFGRLAVAGLCLALLAAFSVAHPNDWVHASQRAGSELAAPGAAGADGLYVVYEPELCALCLGVSQARSVVPIQADARVQREAPSDLRRVSACRQPRPTAPILAGHPTRAPPHPA